MGRARITELPDALLTQILSYLPTKDSVKTSVLSKRWEWLWLDVPVLDFDVYDFPDCPDFIDDFLESCDRLEKFKINYDEHESGDISYHDRFEEWISTSVDLGVQHLDVEDTPCSYYMPYEIYESNTLVSLKLAAVWVAEPNFAISMPCLKILRLEDIWSEGEPLNTEKLISGCPVLEDLTIIRSIDIRNQDFPLCLRVRSQSLKRFSLMIDLTERYTRYSVEIDAPRLEYLRFDDQQSDAIVMKNLSSLSMIQIDTGFNVEWGTKLDSEDSSKRDVIHGFLTAVSSVRRMIISPHTLKILDQYSKFGAIPKFNNLYRLETWFSSSMLTYLQVFLESCPNLKHLIVSVWEEPEQTKLTNVPQCLSLNLECVEIKRLIVEEEKWKQVTRYFLENSAVLKKLVLYFKEDSSVISHQDSDIFKEFHTYTKKLSRKCQIIIHRSTACGREDWD